MVTFVAEQSDGPPCPKAEHRVEALAAAGIVGTWERDHHRQTFRLCRGAAELLAGDADLAWQNLTHAQALTNVYADDLSWLREQLHRAASVPGLHIREYRVRNGAHGVRRVLTRGRTHLGPDGRPSHTLGVIIDITEIEADGRRRRVAGDDKLDSAAEYGVAAYEAIQGIGLRSLLHPARALLMAIGREIARRTTGRSKSLH